MCRLLRHGKPGFLDVGTGQRNSVQSLLLTRRQRSPQSIPRDCLLWPVRYGHGLHLCRLIDCICCFRWCLRCAVNAQLSCGYSSASAQQETPRYARVVLDERGSGVHCQRGFVFLYNCLRRHFLFPICNASRRRVYELHIPNYGRSLPFRPGILVHQAEELCWAEEGRFGYCGFGKGCPLR